MEEQLIEEVRKYGCLYNVQSKDYRDQRKRQEAWEEIGENVSKNWQECRDAWTKLRNAYTNAVKRRKTTRGQGTKKISKWKFEDQMSFLSIYLEHRSWQSSFEFQYEDNDESQIASESNRNIRGTNDLQAEDEESGNEDPATTIGLSKDLNAHGNAKARFCRNTPATSNKRIKKSRTELVKIMKSNNRIRSQIIQPPEPPVVQSNTLDDEIDLFFLSMAKTVKKLPKSEQVRLKMGISNLVFEAELKNTFPDPQPQVSRRSSFSEACSTASMPYSSPVPSSANSFSNQSEVFIQSPSALHYFPHTQEKIVYSPLNIQDDDNFLTSL